MKDKISGHVEQLSEKLTSYKTVVDDIEWKGSASNTFYGNVTDLMSRLQDIMNNVYKLVDALNLIDEIKAIDEEISRLNSSLVGITDNMSETEKINATTYNNGIYGSINSKKRDRY